MSHQKVTRDVLDLKSRPINVADTPGIEVVGDCGANFSIDGVPIGRNGTPCEGQFTDLWVDNDVEITGNLSFMGAPGSNNLDMNGSQITSLANAVLATDALPYGQANTEFVNVTGDSMSGALTLSGLESAGADAADRDYADSTAASAASSAVGAYQGFGAGQFWQFTGLTHNMTYTNTTGRPIYVSVAVNVASSGQIQFQINGLPVTETDYDTLATNDWCWHGGVVPNGATYRLHEVTPGINTTRWYAYSL